jgi:hypothetical protein
MLADGPVNGIGLYTFHAINYQPEVKNDSPTHPGTKWRVVYTSKATSKHKGKKVAWMCHTAGTVLRLNLGEHFGDAGYDMCGCEITVVAWQGENREADAMLGAKITVPVHNRFRWFDAQKFLKQVNERVKEPWRIDQGRSGLCGMAALYYLMIKKDAQAYKRLAIELHRTGIYDTGKCVIAPKNPVMFDISPQTNQRFKNMLMWDADWIVLGGTRSSESSVDYDALDTHGPSEKSLGEAMGKVKGIVNKIEAGAEYEYSKAQGSYYDYAAGTSDPLEKKLLLDVAGYRSVSIQDDGKTKPNAVSILQQIDAEYSTGKSQFVLDINANMIETNNFGGHWVVYAGGLNMLELPGKLSFRIFTWARNPDTRMCYSVEGKSRDFVLNVDTQIAYQVFIDNFYGYIKAE